MKAIKANDRPLIKRILDSEDGCSIDLNVALMFAVCTWISSYHRYKLVKLLCKRGADPNYEYDPSVHGAIMDSDEYDPNGYLLRKSSILTCAVNFTDPSSVQVLLEFGADPKAHDHEAFLDACEKYDVEQIQPFIKHGADIRTREDEALVRAVGCNTQTNLMCFLLDNGADVNAQNGEPLVAAACGGDYIVDILLEYGADVHKRDNEALKTAIDRQRVDNVKMLVNYGGADTSVLNAEQRAYVDHCLSMP